MRIHAAAALGLALLLLMGVVMALGSTLSFPSPKTCHTVTVTCYR